MKLFRTKRTERGAALLEFAVLMPLLLLLILGIVELGFMLGQMNEIRHGAREGARYAAVSRPNYDGGGGTGDAADVLAVVCDTVNLPGSVVTVSLTGGTDRYDYATLTVQADVDSLSGAPLITSFLPDMLTNEATFRLEQDAGWSTFGATAC